VRGIGQHRDDDVTRLSDLAWVGRPLGAVADQLVNGVAVVDDQLVPGAHQMARHRLAHDAETDEAHFLCHQVLL
jgi:hypothetical protein